MGEGPEEFPFYPTEAPACKRDFVQPICGTEAENRFDGSDEEGNLPVLPSGKITNPMEDDIAVLCCIGITIDD